MVGRRCSGCRAGWQPGGRWLRGSSSRSTRVGPQVKTSSRRSEFYEHTRKDDVFEVNRTLQCSLHLRALRSPTCGSYRIASCFAAQPSPLLQRKRRHTHSLTLTFSSLEHDASVGLHAADHAINSPIGHIVMAVGGEIPGPVGTAFHVVAAVDDACVLRGCVACLPLLSCGSQHACRYHHDYVGAAIEGAEAVAHAI